MTSLGNSSKPAKRLGLPSGCITRTPLIGKTVATQDKTGLARKGLCNYFDPAPVKFDDYIANKAYRRSRNS